MSEPLPRTDSTQAMQNLFSAYKDPEDDEGLPVPPGGHISGSDDEHESLSQIMATKRHSETPKTEDSTSQPPKLSRKATRLVSYGPEEEDKDMDESDSDSDVHIHMVTGGTGLVNYNDSLNSQMASSLSRSVQNMAEEEIHLPPEPQGKCSKKLQEKIVSFYDKRLNKGNDLNASIQRRKDFRNPSIFEKLVSFIGIEEKGSNFPPEIYNPSIWGKESFYDELARVQKVEMDKREKERRDRTKVDFVTGTKKVSTDGSVVDLKRKTKWDAQPGVGPALKTVGVTAGQPAIVSISTSSAGSKTTVISAVGTIKKEKKT